MTADQPNDRVRSIPTATVPVLTAQPHAAGPVGRGARPVLSVPLVLRLVWLLQPLAFVPLIADATSELPSGGSIIVASIAWSGWAAVLLATFVPSTVSLTAGRLAAPLALVVVVVAATGPGAAGWRVAVAAAAALLALGVWSSGDTGRFMAQGSAYGDEQRFPLKPPIPYLVPMVVTWFVVAGILVTGTVLIANERWIAGGLATIAAVAAVAVVGRRFHQFSRRWLVVVPVGVVVHDPVLLAENTLLRQPQLASLHLAPRSTEAADLTGGTSGVALEVVLRELETVIKIGSRDQPAGTALHVRSLLVAPTRPGRALAAAAARDFPVG